MSATLVYWATEGGNRLRALKLTICSEEDRPEGGLANVRRRRLCRILREAVAQGARLGYRDLCMIMLASKATLKRDMVFLRKQGFDIRLRGNG